TYRDEQLTTPDITTWAYHLPTGLLTSKTYADAKAVSYTYSSDGKLATRTWARPGTGEQLFALYSYHAATGELAGIDYSDSTPDIAFTYNRLGQQATVADAVGTRTFGYNAALQLTSEAIAGGLYSKTICRSYATNGVLGRYTGISIGAEYAVSYGYDAYGRSSTLTSGTDTFTTSYHANSDLVSGIAYPNDIVSTRSYEPNRDLITAVENSLLSVPSVVISRYDYTNDAIGRRTEMEKSGTAFSQTDSIAYGYNDRSEVVSAEAENDSSYDFGYEFDPIGNRLTSRIVEDERNYTSNNLNQYTAIDNPSVTPSYDDDGNTATLPIASGSWTCTWDAENRLVAMEKSDQRLEFAYDYASRRVEKKTFTGSSGNWALTSHLRFVYDGFLQIEKLNGADSNALLVTRAWTGVEGYDRLIAENHVTTGNTYYALADANKNITCFLTNAGAIAGHFEFSPFGQITRETGALSDQFDFRFSSEFFEQETGLVYYNFRYYSPELGRWLGRDEIEENGGINIYGFGNNVVIGYDALGNKWVYFWRPGKVITLPIGAPPPDDSDTCRYIAGGEGHGIQEWKEEVLDRKWQYRVRNQLSDCQVIVFIGHNSYVENIISRAKMGRNMKIGLLGCFSGDKAVPPKGHEISDFPSPEGYIGWRKEGSKPDSDDNAGYPSFDALIQASLAKAKADAQQMAEDCRCVCEEIVVYVNCQTPGKSKDRPVERLNREYRSICNKVLQVYPCKRRRASSSCPQ
ncbi:MAG TPA: RHS repeat-associated core domain-containing protein, partial [Promineifilum sp.]|nr:RHS repeat-associated core domain-containing protein [Promineifilum sp.]